MAHYISSKFASFETTHALIDRDTGKMIGEPAPLTKALRTYLFYNTTPGRILMQLPPTWWLLSLEHKRMAAHANSPDSKEEIPSFVKTYHIKPEDSEKPLEEYKTLQEFFARRLRPGMRPIAEPDNPGLAVHPADSRVVVFSSVDQAHRLWIKGRHFTVGRLLGPGYDPAAWQGAAVAVSRLSPCDCHRLFASVSGRVVKISRQGTRFMASMWVSTHSNLDVLTENERLIMEFDNPVFGTVVQVMIGASDVGSVQPLVKEGDVVTKGQEVAHFAFGGSIMTTLFHAGTMDFDYDLIQHSQGMCETLCRFGSSLGRVRRPAAGGTS